MNKARDKLGISNSNSTSTSLFSTASGHNVSITPLQMQQANSLLESLANQNDNSVLSFHALPASPPKDDSPIRISSNRHRIECEAGNDGPIKPHLDSSPASKKPQSSVSKKKKGKQYVPIKINNNNYIYDTPEARKSIGSKAVETSPIDDKVLMLMSQINYEISSEKYETGFSSLTRQLGRPFATFYEELHDSLMKLLKKNDLLEDHNTATAIDIQYAISHCQYEIQTKLNSSLDNAGIPSFLLSINHRNSEFVMYESDEPTSLPTSFYSDNSSDADEPSPMFNHLINLMSSSGADRSLLSVAWIRCQYRNIIWKQSSKVKWTSSSVHLQFRVIVQQLLWRYLTELYISFTISI